MKFSNIIKPHFKKIVWSLKTFKFCLKRRDLEIEELAQIVSSNLGLNVKIGENSIIFKSSIGNYSYVGGKSSIANAQIGRYCSIAGEVIISPGIHPKIYLSTHPILYPNCAISEYQDVVIGNDVWIGQRAIIMGGVNIGDGAIVGANAVVTKDLEAYGIYVGVPAKLIGYRFDKNIISKLLESQWWQEEGDWLIDNKNKMQEVEKFIEIINERRCKK